MTEPKCDKCDNDAVVLTGSKKYCPKCWFERELQKKKNPKRK